MVRTCILRAFGLQMSCRLYLVFVTFVLFRFCLYAFIEASALRSIVLRQAGAPTATRVSSFVSFVYLEMSLFPSTFVPWPLSLCMESTSYFFSFRIVFFYLVTSSWIFLHQLIIMRIQSINQSRIELTTSALAGVCEVTYRPFGRRGLRLHIQGFWFGCKLLAKQWKVVR